MVRCVSLPLRGESPRLSSPERGLVLVGDPHSSNARHCENQLETS